MIYSRLAQCIYLTPELNKSLIKWLLDQIHEVLKKPISKNLRNY